MAVNGIAKIAILTGGGDCPGLNAVIRAVAKSAINQHGLEVVGIEDGFLGLIENRMRPLSYEDVSSILTVGGTILGASNKANPFQHIVDGKKTDVSDRCMDHIKQHGIDALVCLGGDGTMAMSSKFAQKGIPVIGVPKTIDNDLPVTDFTFGFDTAVTTATEAIDKIQTTASSHHRAMVVEVMGRYAGWIALHSGVASGGDAILIPEIPYDINRVCEFVQQRSKSGRRFSIIVAAEGAKPKDGKMVIREQVTDSPDPVRLGGIGDILADQVNEKTGVESRAVVLGHVIRGGTPTPFDRNLATMLGYAAMQALVEGKKDDLVVYSKGTVSTVKLEQIAGKIKNVPLDHPLLLAARGVRTCFGD